MRNTTYHTSRLDKELLLVLTDGKPADIDSHDQRMLTEDARKAVQELY